MYAATGDERFKMRVAYILDELEMCQQVYGNGYVSAIPNGKKLFAEMEKGDIRAKPFDLNGGLVAFLHDSQADGRVAGFVALLRLLAGPGN